MCFVGEFTEVLPGDEDLTAFSEMEMAFFEQDLQKVEEVDTFEDLVQDEPAPNEGDGGTDEDPRELAERRAAMKAWVQYSRALFSAAEFRFIS